MVSKYLNDRSYCDFEQTLEDPSGWMVGRNWRSYIKKKLKLHRNVQGNKGLYKTHISSISIGKQASSNLSSPLFSSSTLSSPLPPSPLSPALFSSPLLTNSTSCSNSCDHRAMCGCVTPRYTYFYLFSLHSAATLTNLGEAFTPVCLWFTVFSHLAFSFSVVLTPLITFDES